MIKLRFYVENNYPFCKYAYGVPFYPKANEIKEIEKYPYFFKDITIEYKILEQKNNKILKVQNLRDNRIFKIGDKVWYKLDWVKNKLKFTITDFSLNGSYNDILIVHSKSGQMCELTLINKL